MGNKSPVIWREAYERDKKKWFQRWAITVLVAFIILIGSFCYFQEEAFLARKSNLLQGVVDDYKIKFEILGLLRTKGISLNQGLDIANMAVIQSKQLRLPLPLILAIMGKESEYLPHAISNKGAKGLMQLIPATFDLYIKKLNLGVSQSAIFDPIVNVLVAVLSLPKFNTQTAAFVLLLYIKAPAVVKFAGFQVTFSNDTYAVLLAVSLPNPVMVRSSPPAVYPVPVISLSVVYAVVVSFKVALAV